MSVKKEIVVKIVGDASSLSRATTHAKTTLTKEVASMKKIIGGIAIAYASVAVAIKSIQLFTDQVASMTKISATFESFETTLINIEGSSQRAKQSLSWIENFSAQTPYQIEQVTQSFASLKAYGLDAIDETLRTLGDAASAMNKPLQQAAQALAGAVVGENEKLKEFGIRAKIIGDEIKYTWMNASNEARQVVVANNSAIIQSTLTSIFNSKYAGAMQIQAQTWNGMLSNIQDNWTIVQKNILNAGLFDYLKAIVKIVGEYLNKAFGEAGKHAGVFTKYTINAIKNTIKTVGLFYDILETTTDMFSVLKNAGALGFWGIQYAALSVASLIDRTYTDVVNAIINKVNAMARAAVQVAKAVGIDLHFQQIDSVAYSKLITNAYGAVTGEVDKYTKQLALSLQKLLDSQNGEKFANKFLLEVDKAYSDIQKAPEIQVEKIDFGDVFDENTLPKEKNELKKVLPNITDDEKQNIESDIDKLLKIQDEKEKASIIKNTSSNTQPSYKQPPISIDLPITKLTSNLNTAKEHINELDKSLQSAIKNLQSFTFKFKDSFIKALQDSQNSLKNIFKSSSQVVTLNYQDAYEFVKLTQQKLIQNPLDVKIGEQYQNAYNAFISASDKFLSDQDKFSSQADYLFASATISSQTNQLQNTAKDAYSVLDNMKDLLKAINKAMEDGILTSDEKETIAGVADKVNRNNTRLIGRGGLIKAVNSQEYYNNTNLAKDSSLVGGNSISSYINALNGNGKGITLDKITSSVGTLAVNTGLNLNQIAQIQQNTANINSATNGVKSATYSLQDNTRYTTNAVNAMAGGKSLRNLQLSGSRSSRNVTYGSGKEDWGKITSENQWTRYDYYAKGGFTKAAGKKDKTGYKIAGIVHENEWVAPPWMLKKHPSIFKELENMRVSRYAKGGFTSNTSLHVSSNNNTTNNKILNELISLNRLLANVTENGDAMRIQQ